MDYSKAADYIEISKYEALRSRIAELDARISLIEDEMELAIKVGDFNHKQINWLRKIKAALRREGSDG